MPGARVYTRSTSLTGPKWPFWGEEQIDTVPNQVGLFREKGKCNL